MPELPEVAAFGHLLAARLNGSLLATLELGSLSALKTVTPSLADLVGRQVVDVERRGKYLGLRLVDDQGVQAWLVWHLARAGWLHWRAQLPSTPLRPGKHPVALRAGFVNVDGEVIGGFDLTEAGSTKHLSVYAAWDLDEVPGIARLGIDPCSEGFTREAFEQICQAAGRTQVKGMLTDQTRIAGIGNAYSDEILHAARLSPFAPASGLTEEQRTFLYECIRRTLELANEACLDREPGELKDAKRSHLAVHGRTAQPCRVCGDDIAEVAFADRSLQYCPTCQTAGKPLADRRFSRLLK